MWATPLNYVNGDHPQSNMHNTLIYHEPLFIDTITKSTSLQLFHICTKYTLRGREREKLSPEIVYIRRYLNPPPPPPPPQDNVLTEKFGG